MRKLLPLLALMSFAASAEPLEFRPSMQVRDAPPGWTAEWKDVATWVGPISEPLRICLSVSAAVMVKRDTVTLAINRLRIESGVVMSAAPVLLSTLEAEPDGLLCFKDQLKQTGHWSYEMRMCPAAGPESDCSPWARSVESGSGKVDGVAKGWWLYAFLPKPSGGGITQERNDGKSRKEIFSLRIPGG